MNLEKWRARRARAHPSTAGRVPLPPPVEVEAPGPDSGIEGLELAVARLEALLPHATGPDGRLDRSLETEVLALIGELAMGLVGRATHRAQGLAARLSSGAATP